jgi:glyoxylase I family protein
MSETAVTGRGSSRFHHIAMVVQDQERNRAYVEDVLGIPFVATWAERSHIGDFGEQNFCHTFYELEDGSALAFFCFESPEMYEACRPEVPAKVTMFDHISMKVSTDHYTAMRERLITAGALTRETDHGYCKSLYTRSPDGWLFEFTLDPADEEEMKRDKAKRARADLDRWLAGDRTNTNDYRAGMAKTSAAKAAVG